jgi:hypothetical protein
MKIFARLLQGQLMLDVNQFLHIILRINMVIDILHPQTLSRPTFPHIRPIHSFPIIPHKYSPLPYPNTLPHKLGSLSIQ